MEIEVIVFNVGCQTRISIIKPMIIRICLSMSGQVPAKFCGRWLFRNTGFSPQRERLKLVAKGSRDFLGFKDGLMCIDVSGNCGGVHLHHPELEMCSGVGGCL